MESKVCIYKVRQKSLTEAIDPRTGSLSYCLVWVYYGDEKEV